MSALPRGVRIKLDLTDISSQEDSYRWMYIPHDVLKSIRDLKKKLCEEQGLTDQRLVKLYLEEPFELPDDENILLLQNGDLVKVKIIHSINLSEESVKKRKKKKKKNRKLSVTETEEEELADEGPSTKKRRTEDVLSNFETSGTPMVENGCEEAGSGQKPPVLKASGNESECSSDDESSETPTLAPVKPTVKKKRKRKRRKKTKAISNGVSNGQEEQTPAVKPATPLSKAAALISCEDSLLEVQRSSAATAKSQQTNNFSNLLSLAGSKSPLRSRRHAEAKDVTKKSLVGRSYVPLERLPKVGERVSFRILEILEDYTPGLSAPKEGYVSQVRGESVTVALEDPVRVRREGKFELPMDEEEFEGSLTVSWADVKEAQLVIDRSG